MKCGGCLLVGCPECEALAAKGVCMPSLDIHYVALNRDDYPDQQEAQRAFMDRLRRTLHIPPDAA